MTGDICGGVLWPRFCVVTFTTIFFVLPLLVVVWTLVTGLLARFRRR